MENNITRSCTADLLEDFILLCRNISADSPEGNALVLQNTEFGTFIWMYLFEGEKMVDVLPETAANDDLIANALYAHATWPNSLEQMRIIT